MNPLTETKLTQDDIKRMHYLDNKEYQSKFLLTPDINQEEDYSHLDKNLAITNLKHNPKLKIDEVNEARSILRGLHVLNNKLHYKEEIIKVLIGYQETPQKDKTILRTPVYEKRLIKTSKFPKTYHNLQAEFISLTNTTASRNGHRMTSAITNKLEQSQKIQDLTTNKNKWGFGNKNN